VSTFEIRKSTDGRSFYWVQIAANGETLSTSELYTTKDSAEHGAKAAGAMDDTLTYRDEVDAG
jgi:uncharacterized protein YegP (UPF0339 family)